MNHSTPSAGIGGDGVIRVVPTALATDPGVLAQASGARWFMDYRNADGSVAEMCGNGVRVYATYLAHRGWLPDGELDLTPARVAALCDRRRGLGADGVLRVVRWAELGERPAADPGVEWFMDYRNADGSVAEMCGNGVRVRGRAGGENNPRSAGWRR